MSLSGVASTVYKGVAGLPRKFFGTRNDRMLKQYLRQVEPTGVFEQDVRGDYDERLAQRLASEPLDTLPDEERPARLAEICHELSEDLLVRAASLRERLIPFYEEADTWWQGLGTAERLEEYLREEYRKRHARIIEKLDADGLLAEAFATLREASRRAQAHRHFDCQLVGGRVLFEGRIAEMRTGEGKTIVCHLAAFLQVSAGKKVHIITVNDYLVERDSDFARPIFELVGITVGCIQSAVDPSGREGFRRDAYGCDITYGTNSEFGFDYLRDNMKTELAQQVQGRLGYVIVDEVDSILIDEARTPLIISGAARDDVTRYPRAAKVAQELVRRQVVMDRKVLSTVEKFDGETHNIPKLEDAMNILGYKERKSGKPKKAKKDEAEKTDRESDAHDNEPDMGMPALGPDFLTDEQVEAIEFFENDILRLPASQQYHRYFLVQAERKQASITHDGVTIAQDLLDLGSLYTGQNMEWPHLIENGLRAEKTYQRDRDYVVQDGEVIIVDPFTGRLMHGRQWSDGLHQAVEAKENVRVKEETQTLATITIQNFIKLYLLKAGMTGTASTEATEFDKIYKLEVIEVPTNRPVNRVDHNDKMYRDVEQKYSAIVEEVHDVHRRGRPADPFMLAEVLAALRPILLDQKRDVARIDEAIAKFNGAELGDKAVISFMAETYDESMGDLARGRPILVGTTSVENSEKLSRMLERRYGIEHEVLNAKNHSREAEIVTKAGHTSLPTSGRDKTPLGNVTIATNMAGRGTDIKLGEGVVFPTCKTPEKLPNGVASSELYPVGITKCCINCEEYDAATNCAHCFKPKLDPRFPAMGRTVCPLNVPCGLHIIGTERHEARRIDNQLRGRAGRQGDPGSSRFSLSLEDELLKLFMPDWMLKMMEKLGFTDGSSLEDKRLSKGIERAQRKVEERNFSTRKHLLEWDEPMDYQRREFYSARQRILEERDLPSLIFDTIDNTIHTTVEKVLGGRHDRTCIAEWCRTQLELVLEENSIRVDDLETAQDSIRRNARSEMQDQVRTSIGEYIDAELPPAKWDLSGLLQWAQRLFKFNLTQNQLRKMEPSEIESTLLDAVDEHVDQINLEGIAPFLEENYPRRSLAEWARIKFNIELSPDALAEQSRPEVVELLDKHVRDAYREREVNYPVESCLERAFSDEGTDHAAAAAYVMHWANARFKANWSIEDVQGESPATIRDRLLALCRESRDGGMQREVDAALNGEDVNRETAVAWAKERFGRAFNEKRFDAFDGELPDALLAQGIEMLRWELTRLEQYVLLRIYDQAWKDHLLEMDHLKSAIMQRPLGGDQSHPQSQFAIEGRDLFTQMWGRIAARVTDIIFKVRMTGGEGEATTGTTASGRAPATMTLSHGDATGAGFTAGAADQASAMRAQNTESKVETIRRETPKVGRNDPCPCGSGKKYKQCHGRK